MSLGAVGSLTVAQALAVATRPGVDRLDAQLLLARTLGRSRSWLLAHDDTVLDASQAAELRAQLARRATGEPLAYLLGEKEFHGLTLQVNASVLVPRPDTEVLVDWALELLRGELGGVESPAVIDLGCGSGAIALAVRHGHAAARVLATDASEAALAVAQANARTLGLDLSFACGSWWQAARRQRFHLGLSNPPYIAAGDAHLDALRHEPRLALTPGAIGIEALEAIVVEAPDHLHPGGWLLLEHGFDQAGAVRTRLREAGLRNIGTRCDIAGLERCTGACLA